MTKKQRWVPILIALTLVVVLGVFAWNSGWLLSPARGISGHWEGTGTYYYLDFYGERDLKITARCEMDLEQRDNEVTGVFDIYPISQVDVGPAGYVPAVEEHKSISGIVEGTRFTFYIEKGIGPGSSPYKEVWEFTFTTDNMQGKVTNLDDYAYLGDDSDDGAFSLTKE